MTARVAGENVYLYMQFPKLQSLRPSEEAIELRYKVILVVSIDETLPTVVYKPTGNVCSKHLICSVVFLEASARKMVRMVRAQTKVCRLQISKGGMLPTLAALLAPSSPDLPTPTHLHAPSHPSLQLSVGRTE